MLVWCNVWLLSLLATVIVIPSSRCAHDAAAEPSDRRFATLSRDGANKWAESKQKLE